MDRSSVTIKPAFVKWIIGGLSWMLESAAKSSASRWLIPLYRDYFDIRTDEIQWPKEGFTSLEHYFTRELRQGARPFEEGKSILVSPVDGCLSRYPISQKAVFRIKGKDYKLGDLFKEKNEIDPYLGGDVLIFYLSPSDYHRIHMPLEAREVRYYTRGGFSYPVNDFGLKHFEGVLTKNRRLVSHFVAESGSFAMVSVGALNVNSIIRRRGENRKYVKAEEYGYFSFGSTVLLFLPKNSFVPLRGPGTIKQGESLGLLIQTP